MSKKDAVKDMVYTEKLKLSHPNDRIKITLADGSEIYCQKNSVEEIDTSLSSPDTLAAFYDKVFDEVWNRKKGLTIQDVRKDLKLRLGYGTEVEKPLRLQWSLPGISMGVFGAIVCTKSPVDKLEVVRK